MNVKLKTVGLTASLAILAGVSLAGCGAVPVRVHALEHKTTTKIEAAQARANQASPVVTTTRGAWLLGPSVQVVAAPSPILLRPVAYHPTQRVSLSDIAAWITQATGLVVNTAEVLNMGGTEQMGGLGQSSFPAQPAIPSVGGSPPVPAVIPITSSGMVGRNQSTSEQYMTISYEGPLSGLLDVVANKAGVWWKFDNGRVNFFRTETKTFYLPAIARKSTGSSSITANSGSNGSSGSGGSSSASSVAGAGGGSSSGTSGGGTSSNSDYLVDVWSNLEKIAKAVGNGAQVVADGSVGSVTVTGTPPQVQDVENWVKSLSENLSQQVAITVHVFKVKISNEDNYAWNPRVVFNSLSAKYGFTLAGPQTPAVVSGNTPLSLTTNILQTATGSTAQYSGSSLAFQALSTLGHVTETVQQTVVTLNGQPAPIQIANQASYLASTTMGAPTTIGTAPVPPTLTPGVITTGFTAMFLPRIVNGKILLAMNLTSSSLIGIGTVGSGGSSIQTPNVDVSTFQQSVSLTPGDALMLTGLQQDNGASNHSGVGSANNFLLGGGVDDNTDKQLIAIVITAKVL